MMGYQMRSLLGIETREGLTNVSPVCGPSPRISTLKEVATIDKMKQGKSSGPTGVVSEMLKAAGETGTMWMADVCNAVVRDGRIPEDGECLQKKG